jgi:hypothetical protein
LRFFRRCQAVANDAGAGDPGRMERRMPSERRRLRPYRVSGFYRSTPTLQQQAVAVTLRDRLIADRGGPDEVTAAEDLLIDLITADARGSALLDNAVGNQPGS